MKRLLAAAALALCLAAGLGVPVAEAESVKYVRYQMGGGVHFGILDGQMVRELDGDFLTGAKATGKSVALKDVQLLPPTVPSKVIAVGLNYRSHSGMSGAAAPGLFAKLPSSLVGHGQPIVRFKGSSNLHYEGELVVVIGKRASRISEKDASRYIFGVTAGNDVSERSWQFSDLQWIRAKAADGFGPAGPAVVTGLNYNDLVVQTRLNGEVRQKESTKNMIHGVDAIVSYVSRYITLLPGDMIYTGTPGSTRAMQPGDVVEIEVEGVGVLRNPVVDEK